ncbi:hypothetical protein ONS95_007210 [Cadophora gregata]|nr:uncharacterized protein ONS95_007210 [Cadophora gregata]KAK0100760.1 hypothetical protein ONS95_007210 [Cadophora gregata]KAK0117245.1 hypothetical protein ONS96_013078 [Cadophora gregata f. sp. sojae]
MRTIIQGQPDAELLWREIEIFRMIDKTSKFFFGDVDIGLPTICELQWAIQTWSHFVLAGGLDVIFAKHAKIEVMSERGASPASIFRRYLSTYQAELEFESWDEELMNAFRLKVFQLDQDLRRTKREIVLHKKRHQQPSSADHSMDKITTETISVTRNDHLETESPTDRVLRASKRRKLSTDNITNENERLKTEPLIKQEGNDLSEIFYDASPPPSFQRTSMAPSSELSVQSASNTARASSDVPPRDERTPPLQQISASQPESYLEQSVNANIRRLQIHLADCTERQESASESANVSLGKLITAIEKNNVLDKDTTARLKILIEDFEEEFEHWNLSVIKEQTSTLRVFMDSTHTTMLELFGFWTAATESFEKYVGVLVEKEKWEKKIEIAELVATAFGDD